MRTLATTLLALALCGAASGATIQGTARGERLAGTAGADLILPRGGPDRIAAGGGADRVAAQYDAGRDTVSCGAGRDVVNADANDRVGADCELATRRISRDRYRNPESRHESQVEPDSFGYGGTTVAAFQTGRIFAGGAANIGFAVSSDAGRSWRGGELPGLTRLAPRPGPADRASDPAVAYDAVHATWLVASLTIGATTRLTVNRSPDGFAWSDPVDATAATTGALAYDKEWLVCDNGAASPWRGRCYLAYTDFVRRGLSLQASGDGGLTWSQPVTAPVNVVGAFPVVQPDGTLVVLYRGGTRDNEEIDAVRSRDGGTTLEAPARVARAAAFATGYRFPVLPSADVDATGRIWTAWHDCLTRPQCDGNDVVVSSSSDGVVWTPPAPATSGRNAAIPALAAAPGGGRIGLLYYSLGAGGIDAELVESADGGATWGPPQRLSAQSMSPGWLPPTNQGPMLADYVSLTYAGARPVGVWALASEPSGDRLRQAIVATTAR